MGMPQLVVTAVLIEGRGKSEVARDYGVSRRWVITLVQRYLAEVTMRLKPDKDTADLNKQVRAAEQAGSGLVRTLVMHDEKDPSRVFALVVFESEEKARAREQDPRRQETLQAARAMMADIYAAPPEFTDLTAAEEWTGGQATAR